MVHYYIGQTYWFFVYHLLLSKLCTELPVYDLFLSKLYNELPISLQCESTVSRLYKDVFCLYAFFIIIDHYEFWYKHMISHLSNVIYHPVIYVRLNINKNSMWLSNFSLTNKLNKSIDFHTQIHYYLYYFYFRQHFINNPD